jgi:DNA-binding beta-propeller fold protein YncE
MSALVLGAMWQNGCGSGKQTVAITISPTTATVKLEQTQQFTATVTGNSDTTVTWSVNSVNGGNATVGTVTTLGLYTAPANALNASSVSVTATSNADTSKTASATVTINSGATVTVSPASVTLNVGDSFQFTDAVTNNSGGPTAVTWEVSDVAGGNTTTGTITTTGLYKAPAQIGSTQTFVVKAVLQADSSSFGTANVIVVPNGAPTLSSLNPSSVSQGSSFEDIYLTGSNFVSTSQARVDGVPVPTSFISTSALRARIPGISLETAGTLFIDVQAQNLSLSGVARLTVVSSAPTIIGTSPDSTVQNGAALNVSFDGGYFHSAITAEFNGQPRTATIPNSRQLQVDVTAPDLTAAGLYAVNVRNPALPQQIAAANLAVEPAGAPVVLNTLGVGLNPMAIAVNTATGIAVVANHDSNSLTLIDLTLNPPLQVGQPVPVGTSPTGVAIDNLRNLAVVTNNGSNNISIVDLSASPPVVKATLSGAVSGSGTDLGLLPSAVGVNPLSGKALVVYQNSTQATIIDLDKLNVSATSQITLTGANPQVAIEPRLNWGIVTPGGSGQVSIVNLNGGGQTIVSLIALPSSNGAVRKGGTVTITTTGAHGLTVKAQVTIAGVDDPSFDGTFTVASVPSSTSFTYTQSGPDTTTGSGNGTVSAAGAFVTVALNPNIRGVSINTETEQTVFADPSSTSVTLMSLLSQEVSNTITLETGTTASAVNPLTNMAVTVNSLGNQASVLDLQQPQRLAKVTVGTKPTAVAIDPVTNLAAIVNQGSNTVTILQLGALRPLHVLQISPFNTLTSTSDETLTLTGNGFAAGSVVRLSETPLQTTLVNSRTVTAVIPASMLSAPQRYVIDVVNPDKTLSNVSDFTVMQAIPVGHSPEGVAIDVQRDLAVVTNTGDGTVSVINLSSMSISGTLTVGKTPTGVALSSRVGRAVVANTDSDTVTVIDLDNVAVSATVSLAPSSGTSKPIGVAIHPGSGQTVVADSNSQQVSFFDATNPGTPTTLAVDTGPSSVAIDPTRNIAAVAEAGANTVVIVNLGTKQVLDRETGFQLPTGGIYDPDSDSFLITSSLANNFGSIQASTSDPATATYLTTFTSVGVNPTALDYNYRSSTLVTANTTSQTISVMDFLTKTVKAILPIPASQQFAIAVHPRTNQAVIVDQNNNRVLIVPLPR